MKSFKEAIAFAIRHEEREAAFYTNLAERSESEDQRQALLARAGEEQEHKARLIAVQDQGQVPESKVIPDADMKLAETLEVVPDPDQPISYEEALILGAKREKAAEQLYRDLASRVESGPLKETLSWLADQEAAHGADMERAYDDALKEG
ncbi:MAG: ferritin family protein [Magnetococcales bacterium]|nr:ferritin family protein [Magnetococcales bacterium]